MLPIPVVWALSLYSVDRVALTWLQLHYADCLYAQNMSELTLSQAEYHQRRLSFCQARYMAAIRTLALIRRAARPRSTAAGPSSTRSRPSGGRSSSRRAST